MKGKSAANVCILLWCGLLILKDCVTCFHGQSQTMSFLKMVSTSSAWGYIVRLNSNPLFTTLVTLSKIPNFSGLSFAYT